MSPIQQCSDSPHHKTIPTPDGASLQDISKGRALAPPFSQAADNPVGIVDSYTNRLASAVVRTSLEALSSIPGLDTLFSSYKAHRLGYSDLRECMVFRLRL